MRNEGAPLIQMCQSDSHSSLDLLSALLFVHNSCAGSAYGTDSAPHPQASLKKDTADDPILLYTIDTKNIHKSPHNLVDYRYTKKPSAK